MLINRRRSPVWAAATFLTLTAWPRPLWAQGQVFDVPAQSVRSAIGILAHQADVQILAAQRITGGKNSRGIHGAMALKDALDRLLAGTGLIARQSGPRTYVIVVAQADSTGKANFAGSSSTTRGNEKPAAHAFVTLRSPLPRPLQVEGADILVTGSRTATNGNDQPSPVTTVTADELTRASPAPLADGLNKLPIFVGSTNNATTGNATTNASGNFLNLRGLGAIRTLILLDGHRVPPTAANGTVDVNTMPEMLVKRVDVVTGGASAVYGSDAVSGVVNFVMDTRFNGFKAVAQGGVSSRGDNGQKRLALALGRSLADGIVHLEASYELYNDDGISSRQDRPTTNTQAGVGGAGTATNPFQFFTNYLNSNQSFGGLIRTGPLAGNQFDASGQIVPFVNGSLTGTNGAQNGGDGTWQRGVTLASQLQTQKAFARADIDAGDGFKAFMQASYAQAYNFTAQQYWSFNPVTIAATDAFLSPAQRTALSGLGAPVVSGVPVFSLGKLVTDQPAATIRAYSPALAISAGLRGELTRDLHWDVFLSHASSTQRVVYDNNNNNGRQYAALDAVVDPVTGAIVCRVSLTNPGLYPGCVPYNPFTTAPGNAAAAAWIRGTTQYSLKNTMDDLVVTISGRLLNNWAGPVTIAINAETRLLRMANTSSAQPGTPLSCTGLRFNCNPSSVVWTGNVTADMMASERVSEGALEATVPLLESRALAKSLEVNGSLRYAHYSVSGNAATWKFGAVWRPDAEFTFRATHSRDMRAPTLYDLFQPNSQNLAMYSDIHTGVSQVVPNITFGNVDLKPETSYTTTAGLVFKSRAIPGLSMTLDYYDISLTNVIALVQGTSAATQAVCEQSNGLSAVCKFYARPLPFSNRGAVNFPSVIYSQPLNIAATHETGIDFELGYGFRLNRISNALAGSLFLRTMTTFQPTYKSNLFSGQPLVNSAGTASVPPGGMTALSLAKWRVMVSANYKNGPFEADALLRWRSVMGRNGDPSVSFIGPKVPAYAVGDANISYHSGRSGDGVELFLSVQNVFDNVAQGFASTAGGPFVPGDDIIGRMFTAGVRVKM